MRSKAILLVAILLISTNFAFLSSELDDSVEKMSTSIGNMPKNIAEAGDTGKYTTINLDGLIIHISHIMMRITEI